MIGRMGPGFDAARQLLGKRRASPGAVVLGYHDVVAATPDDDWSVSADALAAHIGLLRRLGMRIVDLEEIVTRHRTGQPIDGLAAITFDDALLGVYRHAKEVLVRAEAPATVFVVSGTIGLPPPWWPGADRTMTGDELAELTASGIRLAAHTRSHRSLPSLDAESLRLELRGCRSDLREFTEDPVDLLAYPSGHHDRRVREAAAHAGYSAAFTFLNGRWCGPEDPLRLPRLTMGRHMNTGRLAYHLLRPAGSWPDHQLGSVTADG